MLQTFVITFVGAGIPPLRISASGTAMPSRSVSNGGNALGSRNEFSEAFRSWTLL
jgi:hypothetical protein